MKDIQKEAKERYPIGCKFQTLTSYPSKSKYVLKLDNKTYSINGNSIWAGKYQGCLYYGGKWAKIISYPKNYIPPINKFENYEIY